jgi:hypothetical protein
MDEIDNLPLELMEEFKPESGSLEEVVEMVTDVFKQCEPWHLEIEVLAVALYALKNTPEMSIKQALNVGLNEWDV